jgi:hypothetical protein
MPQARPRGLPGLAKKGLGEPEQSGEAPSCLFRGWQANPNSIFSDGVLPLAKEEYLRLQMDVWFCAPQEPCPEATTALVPNATISPRRLFRARREGNSVCPIDFTYHGCTHFSSPISWIRFFHGPHPERPAMDQIPFTLLAVARSEASKPAGSAAPRVVSCLILANLKIPTFYSPVP